MYSSSNPGMLSDILQHTLFHAKPVRKKWEQEANILITKQALFAEFHVDEEVIASLKSPDLVYSRLCRIFKRGKVKFFKEYQLYQLYCAGCSINLDFIHLLDNDEKWFDDYFSCRHPFLLESSLLYANIIGNLDLVKYLVEKMDCKPKAIHVNAAAASGELALVKYLIEDKECDVSRKDFYEDIFYNAIHSGKVEVLKYVAEKYNWQPPRGAIKTAVSSGRVEMVKYLHETYRLEVKKISFFDIQYSRNLLVIKYLLETAGWKPKSFRFGSCTPEEITATAYSMGMIEVVKYIEEKFPFPRAAMCEPILRSAIRSGDMDTINHLLSNENITPQKFKELIGAEDQLFLELAFKSGNLDVAKFLLEECCLIPTKYELFGCAARSGSIELVCYLIEKYNYEITDYIFQNACLAINLELVSFLFHKIHNIDSSLLSHLFTFENRFMVAYHLMIKENHQPDEDMLNAAFIYYCTFKSSELMASFIQELISVYHLKPTEKMIETTIQRDDQKMLAILQNEKWEENDEVKQSNFRMM